MGVLLTRHYVAQVADLPHSSATGRLLIIVVVIPSAPAARTVILVIIVLVLVLVPIQLALLSLENPGRQLGWFRGKLQDLFLFDDVVSPQAIQAFIQEKHAVPGPG